MASASDKIELFAKLVSESVEAKAKKKIRVPTSSKKKKVKRNAVPKKSGGRKDAPKKGGGAKAALLRRIHKDPDIQKILEKNPKYDIIVVKKAVTAASGPDDATSYTLKVNDADGALREILNYLKYCGDVGHSVSFKIDDKSFGFDGDGADKIYSFEIDGQEAEKYKEETKASTAAPLDKFSMDQLQDIYNKVSLTQHKDKNAEKVLNAIVKHVTKKYGPRMLVEMAKKEYRANDPNKKNKIAANEEDNTTDFDKLVKGLQEIGLTKTEDNTWTKGSLKVSLETDKASIVADLMDGSLSKVKQYAKQNVPIKGNVESILSDVNRCFNGLKLGSK